MRAVVTCESCGHRQTVARPIGKPESFHMVCHECEGVLKVEVTERDLLSATPQALPRARNTAV